MRRGLSTFRMFVLIAGLAILLATLLCVPSAFADNLYGSILGVVTDASGAVLPNVQVKITNVNTGVVKQITTGSDGGFQFLDLQPGKYDLVATQANFKLFGARGIEIIQNETYVQNVKMEVGAASERLQEAANPPQEESSGIH